MKVKKSTSDAVALVTLNSFIFQAMLSRELLTMDQVRIKLRHLDVRMGIIKVSQEAIERRWMPLHMDAISSRCQDIRQSHDEICRRNQWTRTRQQPLKFTVVRLSKAAINMIKLAVLFWTQSSTFPSSQFTCIYVLWFSKFKIPGRTHTSFGVKGSRSITFDKFFSLNSVPAQIFSFCLHGYYLGCCRDLSNNVLWRCSLKPRRVLPRVIVMCVRIVLFIRLNDTLQKYVKCGIHELSPLRKWWIRINSVRYILEEEKRKEKEVEWGVDMTGVAFNSERCEKTTHHRGKLFDRRKELSEVCWFRRSFIVILSSTPSAKLSWETE